MSSKFFPSKSGGAQIVFASLIKTGLGYSDQPAIVGARTDFVESTKDASLLSAAAQLHTLLANEDDRAANIFLSSASFNLSVLKALLQLQSLDDDQRTVRLKEAEAQLAEVDRKKKNQTRKAIEAKRINCNIPKIKAWLLELERHGENVGERHIAGKISLKFGVTATHARNIRNEYIAEKVRKAQQ